MRSAGFSRRSFLAAAGSSALLPWAWAQTDGALRLLQVPKLALVIGNARYTRITALRNPGNDAEEMASVLRECGFVVSLLLDANRERMQHALDDHCSAIAARQAIGLLYFAGHGVQLAWRNFLLPVDAEISRAEDIPARSIDVGNVMAGLRNAANPMNVVILDACRNNPFGDVLRPPQAGLSQMDAPPSTLLAYATAPGNGADDGPGKHGLYTGHLVREMRVKEARIEDVFKRVRLGVRKESQGAQIPWESTSLEEDFYFHPPPLLAQASAGKGPVAADVDRAFWQSVRSSDDYQQYETYLQKYPNGAFAALARRRLEDMLNAERKFWDDIRLTDDLQAFERYLRRYPSGKFAELAQLRLDQLLEKQGEKRIELASSAGSPNTAGTVKADTGFKVGDKYSFRVLELFTGIERSRSTETVTAVSKTEVEFDQGRRILDLLGNVLKSPDGLRSTGVQVMGLDYSVGKRWTSRASVINPRGERGEVDMSIRVTGRERITVPAGTFDCFKVVGTGYLIGNSLNTRIDVTRWLAPDKVRVPVVHEVTRRSTNGQFVESFREELVAYSQS